MSINIIRIANTFTFNNKLLCLFPLYALLILLSACATTGGNQQADQLACSSADEKQSDCNLDGVIEINQKIGVDPEIKQEFNAAIALLNDEKYSEAIRLLKGVTGKTSKFTAPYINLGIAYARTGEMDKAEEILKKALEINAQHPVANNELGIVYRKTGQFKKAREHYQIVVNTYPEFLPVRKNLGVLCDIYMQDLECALEQYEEYLKRKPDDEKVKIWLADVKSRI
jgi:tetratricopeptide (TPR) repeat protein